MRSRRGTAAFLLAAAGVGWGLMLVVGAFTFPVYQSMSQSAGEAPVHLGRTLVEVNGPGALIVVGIPALIASAVFLWLHRACATGDARARGRALGVAIVLFLLSPFAAIGLFVAPMALLLGASAALTPVPPGPGRTAS